MERVVIDKQAHYLIKVKANTPALYAILNEAFQRHAAEAKWGDNLEFSHGRIQHRYLQVVPISPIETNWPHTWTACRVVRDRELLRRGVTVETTHGEGIYVSSASYEQPERFLTAIRGHWGIENRLHHRKDRSMGEDRCRASARGIGRVMSCIRSIVAQIACRTKESMSVIRRRFAGKPHLLIKLLNTVNLTEWEQSCTPYKLN